MSLCKNWVPKIFFPPDAGNQQAKLKNKSKNKPQSLLCKGSYLNEDTICTDGRLTGNGHQVYVEGRCPRTPWLATLEHAAMCEENGDLSS